MKPIGRTFGQLPNIFLANDKMGKSSGLRRVVSSGKYLSTYGETAKHVTGTSRVGCPFTRSNTQAGLRGVPAKDVGWFYPAAWVRIPLAPPVAGSLPDDLRGWGIPQPEMKMLGGVLVPLGSPTWNISTDGQCLQLITEITKVQIFYVPPALRTCRKGLKPFW